MKELKQPKLIRYLNSLEKILEQKKFTEGKIKKIKYKVFKIIEFLDEN